MLGIILGAVALFFIERLGMEITDPFRDRDFKAGYTTGMVAALVCLAINVIF